MKRNEIVTQYLTALEQQNYWRLFVDGYRQTPSPSSPTESKEVDEHKSGPLFWSKREPVSLKMLKEATKWVLLNKLDSELDYSLIDSLSELTFPYEDYMKVNREFLYNPENETITYGFVNDKNREEIKIFIKHLTELTGLDANRCSADGDKIEIAWTLQAKKGAYSKLLTIYNDKMSKAIAEEEKFKIIMDHLKAIEYLHLYTDGNGRIEYVLLNKELIKHGMEPVILHNPNCYDFMDTDNLATEVRTGQKAYKKFIESGLPYDNCITDSEIRENISKLNQDKLKHGEFTYEKLYQFVSTLKNNVTNSEDKFGYYQKAFNEALKEHFPGAQIQTIMILVPALSTGSANPFYGPKHVCNYLDKIISICDSRKDLDLVAEFGLSKQHAEDKTESTDEIFVLHQTDENEIETAGDVQKVTETSNDF